MRLSTKIFIGFALVLILMIVSFWVNSTLFDKVRQNTEFVTRSESIIRNSTRLHKTMIDMQSSFRGFLLTDNENFLDNYYQGIDEVPAILAEQHMLVKDSPLQLRKLDSILMLHNDWIKYSGNIIKAKKDSVADNAGETAYKLLFENQLKKEVGKNLNDQITRKFREFDAFEYRVRIDRREMLTTSIERTRRISVGLAIASVSVGLLCALYITRLISKRIAVMVELAGQIAQGNFKSIDDNENDELTGLSASLNAMSGTLEKNITELERKNRELDQFAYVVSHDLKAPLRGIDNVCQWIEEDMEKELSPEMKHYLGIMRGRVHRLEDLINGLLEYARIGRVKRIVQKIDVKELLNEVEDLVVPPGFVVKQKGDMPVINGEKLRLEQVLVNLLSNAVKHHHRNDGIIIVGVEDEGEFYKFTVQDDGPGISPEYHEKIFGIFQTLRERDSKESTGVGLAIVKKIIDDQKGTITVRSNPGEGAVFEFRWPKVPAAIV
jgi:signal transduction histidine kinase